MQYFGVPKCPYCKKRVNLIRTWSLKRQGEYQCPRCGGISNIFLSPLIYVFALLAIFAGGAVYFFHKFVLNDISISTVLQVAVPFAVFFLFSLFMVYLAKPVIKKVPKASGKRRGRRRDVSEDVLQPVSSSGQMFYDDQEYFPKTDYRTGPLPMPEDDRDMKVIPPSPQQPKVKDEMQRTFVVELPKAERPQTVPTQKREASPPVKSKPRPAPSVARRSLTINPDDVSQVRTVSARPQEEPAPVRKRAVEAGAVSSVRPVSAKLVSNDDFFAKYDDPSYVERRLRELKEERSEKG